MPETVLPITNPPTATEISAGPEHYFRIAAVSQREAWFKFEFEEGKTYQVDVRSAGKTLSKGLPDPGVELRTWDADTLLDLFSPGEVIISDYDSGSGNNAALFFHNDLATGTFYLKVFDEDQDFGRFNIQIREIDIAPGPEDDKHKTQLLSSVGTLYSDGWEGVLKIGDINGELGTPINKFPFSGVDTPHVASSIDYLEDVDAFTANLQQGATYEFSVSAVISAGSQLTPEIAVISPTGEVVEVDTNFEGDRIASLSFRAMGSGTYKVEVTGGLEGVTSFDTRFTRFTTGAFVLTGSGPRLRQDLANADNLQGTSASEILKGLAGADVIHGNGGLDVLLGGDGNDTLHGGALSDWIDGQTHNDILYAYGGDDYLIGGLGWDELHGGDGADSLDGGNGNDTIYGDSGDDLVSGGDGADTVFGGAGNDEIHGGEGNDWLNGQRGNDTIFGDAGDDHIIGEDGNDTVLAGVGEDYVSGGDGADWLNGQWQDDILRGKAGDDTVIGEDGDDRLYGNPGDDYLDGGAGDDALRGGPGQDYLVGQMGNDLLQGHDDDDVLRGGAGDDHVSGNAGDDVLIGDDGKDGLKGQAGDDKMFGQEDADRLVFAGGGVDTAVGGAGDDIFVWRQSTDGAEGDVIIGDDHLVAMDETFIIRPDGPAGDVASQSFDGSFGYDTALLFVESEAVAASLVDELRLGYTIDALTELSSIRLSVAEVERFKIRIEGEAGLYEAVEFFDLG